MGVILDSSVVIASERSRETPLALLRRVEATVGNQQSALSAIGYTELVHGTYRAPVRGQHTGSQNFVEQLAAMIPIFPYTEEIARLAGRIDAEQKMKGYPIAFPDLLIGATALHLNFSILTTNERHFRLIPGLDVISF